MNKHRSNHRWFPWAAGAAMALAITAVYSNSLQVPFLLDDSAAVTENASIRHLARVGAVLNPGQLATTNGRPVLNASFALSFALGRLAPESYHWFNLGVHIAAALALFGIVRYTVADGRSRCRTGCEERSTGDRSSTQLAFAAALIWAVHPLNTEAVTYISQRAESLMGLFYLLTLYCFISRARCPQRARVTAAGPNATDASALRATHSAHLVFSVVFCYLGMATKEVMVTAPFIVLLYDRAFWSGSFRKALGQRRWYYAALASSWVFLGWLMAKAATLSQPNVGYHGEVGPLVYLAAECRAVAIYLKLAFWPHPLVFDYGADAYPASWEAVLPHAAFLFAAVVAAIALWRWSRPAGFLASAFFVLLAPTSSFVPVVYQPIAESRMYLPLAALVVGGCGVFAAGLCHVAARPPLARYGAALALLVLALGLVTYSRNHTYGNATALWQDTVAKVPESSRAHYSLGHELARTPALQAEALAQFREALRIRPTDALAHSSIADLLAKRPDRRSEALAEYETALRLKPTYVVALNNYANELAKDPLRRTEAKLRYEQALSVDPTFAKAHYNLANLLVAERGQLQYAITHYERAVDLQPDYVLAHHNLALAYAAAGRRHEAIRQLELAGESTTGATAQGIRGSAVQP